MGADDRIERAGALYERAVFGGDADAVTAADRELDAVEADLALARGRVAHARFLDDGHESPHELGLFERAAELYRGLGDVRGEAEALFWIGCFHQVVRHDDAAAVPVLEQSRGKAVHAGDTLTASYALRHLGIADHRAGRPGSAREHLEESTRLRREVGFLPGVAANLVGLAYVTAEEGHRDEALKLLDEAGSIAEASRADGVLRQVQEARANLGPRKVR
ncbi:tetratricopeptide repeat protein [Streptosporangium saharense]|uniref:tetratricopeptide repeat protein n=1 Tax=Streptosporangium saharense TaxID=1706840 RepID=UPI003422294D